ncbi:MFS transporter [Gluconobacter kanchanaburiensis]|uniref:MFS transporter n=1 Tax=Gluconobacter kanchanaburiensis NBRC 103587 TaxID=1307948 RepID=A0A511B7U6_9PROT|nr:MFS transporter [Gluconobacter kanchanaburiensis]MBF0862401.1 MFS transporter [Gluconobacter kanchanaburiensis]GBR68714.1 major facilitator family transporter [Gluconobacter kanchanaburiensis NBRC 103587]GEK96478.1 MFS transporter [Gluconobacter kanchanaburiensis NBRC 103587]
MSAISPSRAVQSIIAIAIFAGLANASLLCAPVIATQLMTQLTLSAQQVGLFFSMEFAGYCIAGLAGQWLLPRLSWHMIVRAAIVIVVLANLCAVMLLHQGSSLWWNLLLLIRLTGASASAMLGIVAMSSANRHPEAGRAYGFYILGQCVTGVIGLAILPPLFMHWGVSVYFICITGLFLLAAFMTHLLDNGMNSRQTTASLKTNKGQGHPFPVALRRAAVLLFYMGLSGIWTFSGALGQRVGISSLHGGILLSVAAFSGVVGSALAAWYGGRKTGPVSRRTGRALIVGYALLIGALLALTVPLGQAYVTGLIGFKFAWTFVVPFIFATAGKQDRNGEIVAEINLLAGLGLAVSPWIAGQIVAAGSLTLLLLAENILLVLSGLSVFFLRIYDEPSVGEAVFMDD